MSDLFTTYQLAAAYIRSKVHLDTNADWTGWDVTNGPYYSTKELAAQAHLDWFASRTVDLGVVGDDTKNIGWLTYNQMLRLDTGDIDDDGPSNRYQWIMNGPNLESITTTDMSDDTIIYDNYMYKSNGAGTIIDIVTVNTSTVHPYDPDSGSAGTIVSGYAIWDCHATMPISIFRGLDGDDISLYGYYNYTANLQFIVTQTPATFTITNLLYQSDSTLQAQLDATYAYYGTGAGDNNGVVDTSKSITDYPVTDGLQSTIPDNTPSMLVYSIFNPDLYDSFGGNQSGLWPATDDYMTINDGGDFSPTSLAWYSPRLIPYTSVSTTSFELKWNDDGRWYPNQTNTPAKLKYKDGVSIIQASFGPSNARCAIIRPSKDGGFMIYEITSFTDINTPISLVKIFRHDRTLSAVVVPALISAYLPGVVNV